MEITGVADNRQTTGAEAGAARNSTALSQTSLDYDMFLQLLMAQMENQDPLNPTDSTEYVAQLATFSQVEQSIQANQKLDQMLTSMHVAQSESLLGHTVTSADGTVSGVVEAVEVSNQGPVVLLDNGESVAIVDGVKIT